MNDEKLTRTITHLFNRNWDEELTEDQEDALQDAADNLVAEYGWNAVYKAAIQYLHHDCPTPESVVNFALLYWDYRWGEKDIPDPYQFLAYFYYRIDWQVAKYDDRDILDSLAITILPRAGYRDADLMVNTQYMPENDPLMRKAVDSYKADKAH